VSLYRRVDTSTGLPPIGTIWESPTCDFKSHGDPTRFTEMAKDIAAFANATGGVLLVKAVESQGRLQRYLPMTVGEADGLRTAYDTAAKDHCRPSPSIHSETVAHEAGVVLAINVEPFPANPVGVRATPQQQHPQDRFGACFMFPIRVTTGTEYLTPDRLGELMLPKVRTAAILLDRLTAIERSGVQVMWSQPTSGYGTAEVDLIGVNPLALTFEVSVRVHLNTPQTVHIPLDAFKVVDDDYSGVQNRKRIHIDGSLHRVGKQERWQWTPTYRA
jgi:hypothetical protein